MQEEIIDLKSEHIKQPFCFRCCLYTVVIHYCTVNKRWIHLDRFNRIIKYSSTEEGVNPKHQNDLSDGVTFDIPKFAIDNRIEISEVRKEQQEIEADAQQLSELIGIIFGAFANLEITEELTIILNKISFKEVHNSKEWYNVKKFLDVHPDTIYPKEKISQQQWTCFNDLRTNRKKYFEDMEKYGKVQNKALHR